MKNEEIYLRTIDVTPEQSHRVALLRGKPVGILLVHEIYKSIQGESTFAGLPCVFVRLAVCNSRCVWCDTPHAFTEGAPLPLEEILKQVEALQCRLVEVTGGEPLLQDEVLSLMSALADRGKTVLLETSGAIDISPVDRRVHIIMDLKCPDSGEVAHNRWANLQCLKPNDEIKFVVASRGDFDWCKEVISKDRLDERFQVLIGPAYGLVEPIDLAQWIVGSGMRVRMQLQLHKYIWDPKTRGV